MTKDEMLESRFEIARGLYWYAADYHEGQFSPLYSILSTIGYSPRRRELGPDEGDVSGDIYKKLVSKELDPEDLAFFLEESRSDY